MPESNELPAILIAIGTATLFYVCALVAQHVAYARGYLRLGFFLGISLGPLGLLATTALPGLRHPAVALENQRAESLEEDGGDNWQWATWLSLLALFGLTAGIVLLVQGYKFEGNAKWSLLGGGIAAILAAINFYRAEPPMHSLPALAKLEEPGTRDLLEWVHVRHVAARLENTSNHLRRSVLFAIICACILSLFAWLGLSEQNPGIYRRTVGWNVSILLAGIVLFVYAGWAAFAWRRLWARFCQMHEDYFPPGEYVEAEYDDDEYYDSKQNEADNWQEEYQQETFSRGERGAYHHPGPEEMEARLQMRFERVRKQMGQDPGRALHFAATTEDARERTRRMFYLKPVAALAGIWLLFKLLLTNIGRDAAGQEVDWQSAGIGLLVLIGLWLIANAIDWLSKRIMPPP